MAANSGTRGLYKNHSRSCRRPARLTLCGCAWRADYKGRRVCLAVWSGAAVDPRGLATARTVFGRMRTAIDEKRFDPAGEIPAAAATDQTLSAFCDEFQTHHLDATHKRSTATASMLGVLKASTLGARSLDDLASSPELIDRWLKATAKTRDWKASTWNRYFELLRSLFNYGRTLKMHGKPRVRVNPCDDIVPPVAEQPEQFKQRPLTEAIETALLAACDRLDDRPTNKRAKLTQDKADAIRAAVAGGAFGKDVARRFGVSPAVVSAIVNDRIWNPAAQVAGTQGAEMRRRLIIAFDGGPRSGEMLKMTTDHVGPMTFPAGADGKPVRGFVITLPPAITKGGATTGEVERIYVASPRLIRVIEARLFQLKKNPIGRRFLFGTEDGQPVQSFAWHRLYRLAGLTPGRALGVVWHTTRHEFISRLADDPTISDRQRQQLARHKDAATTALYSHTTDAQLFAAVARIGKA